MREFPHSPVVRTWHFHFHGLSSIPGWGTKIPQAAWRGQKKNKKQKKTECNKYQGFKIHEAKLN